MSMADELRALQAATKTAGVVATRIYAGGKLWHADTCPYTYHEVVALSHANAEAKAERATRRRLRKAC